ncbi:hypothetical protein OR16_04092 [Cupriavidus basilensis OR16]|uniref:Response regulatory domain-containing protein n=1 Tax=Cupriavidus basilensis OR16 TaxID=1127483 RepID=H1RZR5_9BURK|nr:response regulator [Cupriavidus basilensis]EHP44131.1 hypothetical protein OR16_04092 [Cupriavidus basilensis OR16]
MPVVACTGQHRPATLPGAREAGFDAFLPKPMTLEELAEAVRALAKIRKPLTQMHDEVREIIG